VEIVEASRYEVTTQERWLSPPYLSLTGAALT
jgi:hypothetical protein